MSKSFRRYEFLLPLKFNDGRIVPANLIADTLEEIEGQFGAVSAESQPIRGRWRHEGKSHQDDLLRVFIDVVDTQTNRKFFRAYKETLKSRFQQLDIWMTTYPIEVV